MKCKRESLNLSRNSNGEPCGAGHPDGIEEALSSGERPAAVDGPARSSAGIGDEKGIALILAILLLTLLASFGIWLMAESQSELRISHSNERREETFHLAESAVWLAVHAVEALSISQNTTSTTISRVTPSNATYAYLSGNQSISNMTSSIFKLSPDIFSNRYLYNSTPPPGWMLNWQGSTNYHTTFFLCRGRGRALLPDASKGNSTFSLYNFMGKITR